MMKKYSLHILVWLALSAPFLVHSYDEVVMLCRVNNAPITRVSCDKNWVKMRSYPEVELKLKDCFSSRDLQKIEVRINNTIYRPNSLSPLEIKYRIDEYLIECADQSRLTNF